MNHKNGFNPLSRTTAHRRAMSRNMVTSLFRYERITTTKSKALEVIADALSGFNHSKYPWIEWDEASKSGKFLHVPAREDIPETIKEQLIVELYSK